ILQGRHGGGLPDHDHPLRGGVNCITAFAPHLPGLDGKAAERGIEGIMQRLFSKVLVTGGAGYCGARLVPQFLERGYMVPVYDTMFFANPFLPRDNPNLRIIDGDVRDSAKFAATVAGHDAVVHLACISNDASFELDEELSTTINLNAFEPMVLAAKQAGAKRFGYPSSGSVYGVAGRPGGTG